MIWLEKENKDNLFSPAHDDTKACDAPLNVYNQHIFLLKTVCWVFLREFHKRPERVKIFVSEACESFRPTLLEQHFRSWNLYKQVEAHAAWTRCQSLAKRETQSFRPLSVALKPNCNECAWISAICTPKPTHTLETTRHNAILNSRSRKVCWSGWKSPPWEIFNATTREQQKNKLFQKEWCRIMQLCTFASCSTLFRPSTFSEVNLDACVVLKFECNPLRGKTSVEERLRCVERLKLSSCYVAVPSVEEENFPQWDCDEWQVQLLSRSMTNELNITVSP